MSSNGLLRFTPTQRIFFQTVTRSPLLQPKEGICMCWRGCWKKGIFIGGEATYAAAESARLDVLEWLKEHHLLLDLDVMYMVQESAATNGHLAVLKLLKEIGVQDGPKITSAAAQSGDLETLKWVRELGYPWHPRTFRHVATKPGWDVLMWLREQGCPWGEGAISGAAMKGRLDVVKKWMRDLGCPLEDFVCSCAARAGQLEMLKWFHERGCPWDQNCCAAARGGHLEVLMWLKEEGCPGYEKILAEARCRGFLDIVIWATENGCYESLDDTNYCRLAAEGGHLKTLKWLREHGFPWDCHTTFGAGILGHADVFFWAVENGCSLGTN